MIDKWAGGLLHPNAMKDPREHNPEQADYNKWMEALGWCHLQEIGSTMGGFSYDVWAWKEAGTWIMSISDGSTCYDVLVEGLADYLDIMAMMAPIATASMLEGDTLGSIFAMHRKAAEQQKVMQEISQEITKGLADAISGERVPCNCDACVANRKKAAEERVAAQN